MSLTRELLVIFFGLISAVNIASASFLTVRHFLIVPGTHQALEQVEKVAQVSEVLPQLLRFKVNQRSVTLPVVPSLMQDGQWPVSQEGVSLSLNQWSGRDQGIVVYGHNWPRILGPLQQVRQGDIVSLSYGDGKPDLYVIKAQFTVSPDRVDILSHAQPGTLLLYTCEGWFDQQRLVVIAQRQLSTPAPQSISLHDPQTEPVFTVE